MRCVSYTRTVSCMPVEDTKEIITKQNLHIAEFAKFRGWKIERKYSDRKADEKEDSAFQKMKRDGIGRNFDCVIMDSIFRCGENVLLASDLFSMVFVPAGIHFAVVEDSFCSLDVSTEETQRYLTEKCDMYRLKQRNAAIFKSLEKRVYEKYGYRHKTDVMELVIDEEAAGVVRDIFNLAIEGKTMNEIATVMNLRKIDSPTVYLKRLQGKSFEGRNKEWTNLHVRNILMNPLYIGRWERTIQRKKVIVSCPAIIRAEDYKKAHGMCHARKPNNHQKSGKASPFAKRIVDMDTGINLHMYTHPKLKCRIFRMRYPKPVDVQYEKAFIEYDEVERAVREVLFREQRKARKTKEQLFTSKAVEEKNKYLELYNTEAQKIFENMLDTENYNFYLYRLFKEGEIEETEYQEQSEKIMDVLNEQDQLLSGAIEKMERVEITFSEKNPWLNIFSELEIPETLTYKQINQWIELIECEKFEIVHVRLKHQEWCKELPKEWFEED